MHLSFSKLVNTILQNKRQISGKHANDTSHFCILVSGYPSVYRMQIICYYIINKTSPLSPWVFKKKRRWWKNQILNKYSKRSKRKSTSHLINLFAFQLCLMLLLEHLVFVDFVVFCFEKICSWISLDICLCKLVVRYDEILLYEKNPYENYLSFIHNKFSYHLDHCLN